MINIGHLITEDIIKSHARYICKDSKIKSNFENIESRFDSNDFKKFMPNDNKRLKFKEELFKMIAEILEDILALEQIEIIGIKNFLKTKKASENIFIADPQSLDSRLEKFKNNYSDIVGVLALSDDKVKLFEVNAKGNEKNVLLKIFLDCFGYEEFSSEKIKYDNYISFVSSLSQEHGKFYKELKAKRDKKNKKCRYTVEELSLFLDQIESRFVDYNYSADIKKQNENIVKNIRDAVDLEKGIGKFIAEIKIIIDRNIDKCKELNNNIDLSIYNYSQILNKNQKWSAYMYLFELGIKTCPYCNRQYITPIYSGMNGKVRADLDHFYAKSKFPFFSMSLYNLIPSCKSCNSSLKGNVEFDYKNYLNPYDRGFENLLKFDYKFKGIDFLKPNGIIEVDLKNVYTGNENLIRKAENNVKCFKLDSLYSFYHGNEVKDMILKRYVYTDEMLQGIQDQLNVVLGESESKETYLQFLFENYSSEYDFHQKPLSKLYKDIVDDLVDKKSCEILSTKKLKVKEKDKQKLEEFCRSIDRE